MGFSIIQMYYQIEKKTETNVLKEQINFKKSKVY